MTADNRPLLFLDVDGVLNVWAPTVPVERWSFPDGRLLLVPTGTAERLVDLDVVFDIVWATTWGRDAPEVFGPLLGVGSGRPVLDFDDEKWPAILDRAGRRRFAWVDDNGARDVPGPRRPVDVTFRGPTGVDDEVIGDSLRPTPNAVDNRSEGVDVRGLVVATDPHIGLDDRGHVTLRRFATEGFGKSRAQMPTTHIEVDAQCRD